MSTTTNVNNLVINKLTRDQFDDITPSATELYFITDDEYPHFYSGSSVPSSSLGNNGDIYILIDGSSIGDLIYAVEEE